jgi:methyl-accepting chemotaxis protein
MHAHVMLADSSLRISYVNPALRDFLTRAEPELKKDMPQFSVAKLVGSNIDIFHKNAAHQRAMLARLDETHRATIWIGKQAFDLIVSPLSHGRKRKGFVVEWADANARLQNIEHTAKIEAIGRHQAMIEFSPDGMVLGANDKFLQIMGYTLGEIVGQHHRLFVDPALHGTQEYADFWAKLRNGEPQSLAVDRIGKGGRPISMQVSYIPISIGGKLTKVVKLAIDVSETVRSVKAIGEALSALANGDLEQHIGVALTPELEKLRTDFNVAVATLGEALAAIVSSMQGIRSGTSEIASATDDLSRRTEQQAASLEQTAAALDQITATVKRSADATKLADSVAARTKQDAEHSGQVVNQAITAMAEIERSAQQVGQIIGVIDEIAFQTNLLALNAGVEAARAGEAGRGFAVVASEVRALAQRSAEAAKEIKGLIQASGQQVSTGVKLVAETGQVLSRIVTQINELNAVVGEIASSSGEQATGLAEVNTAVNQMDQATQQNAAMVEQNTAAARSLAGETEQLAQLTARFRLRSSHARPRDMPASGAAATARATAPAAGATKRRASASPKAPPRTRANTALKLAPALDTAEPGWEEF